LPSLYLGARRIDYDVVRGTSRKYTYFRFRPDMTLEIILPRGRVVNVEKALRDRSVWLQHEYEKLSKVKDVLGDDSVMFDGKLLRVVFFQSQGDSLFPDPGKGEVVVHASERKRLRELVRRWFLKESSAYVVRKVAEMAPKLGVRPSRVDVREMGKWGYCTRSRRLSFSWQLIALPERLREYVVLHELTHLREFNHSPAFKRRLAAFCPDFREREKELNLVTPYNRLAPPG
jgi:predicted metal-dependent hydrolase